MKILVGQREKMIDEGMRDALSLVKLFFGGSAPVSMREFPGKCKNCGAAVKHTFTEERKTGEIWLEGPDSCPTCAYNFLAEDPPKILLSQEAIEKLFG